MNFDTLNEFSEKATQPDKIITKLKDHQLATLYASRALELNDYNDLQYIKYENFESSFSSSVCIIGDDVGSGKSLSILSIIADNLYVKPKHIASSYGPYLSLLHKYKEYNNLDINVIVVPIGIFRQWQKYIETDTEMKFYSISNKKDIKDNIDFYKDFEIILVSSTRYKEFANIINKPSNAPYISRLIFDEADSINIPNCPKINAGMYYFITASVMNLWKCCVRNNGFIKDIFNDIGCYGKCLSSFFTNIVLKNSTEFIEKSNLLEEPIRNILICKSPQSLNILSGIINDDILDMINANDIKGVFEKYEIQITDDMNVIKLICKNYFDELENLKIKYKMKEQLKYKTIKSKEKALKNLEIRISDINNKINLIEERIKDSEMCGICLDDFTNKSLTPCCKNIFCFECLSMALSNRPKCPMCNAIIKNINDIVIIDSDNQFDDLHNRLKVEKNLCEMNKIENFEYLIKNEFNSESRILIFSEYDSSFSDMIDILSKHQINWSKIIGSASQIGNTVDKYKSGEIQYLLLNANYFGSGLNLENTTDIILFHRMNPALKIQVEGRAQRPGRTSQLKIWELLYENEK